MCKAITNTKTWSLITELAVFIFILRKKLRTKWTVVARTKEKQRQLEFPDRPLAILLMLTRLYFSTEMNKIKSKIIKVGYSVKEIIL